MRENLKPWQEAVVRVLLGPTAPALIKENPDE